jgi:hypothetical protein
MLSLSRLLLLILLCVLSSISLFGADGPNKINDVKGGRPGEGDQRLPENQKRPSPDKEAKTKPENLPGTAAVYTSIVQDRPGQQTLVVHYRWKAHARASIEVRLVPPQRAEKVMVSPLYFYGDYFKGKAEEKFYRCLDAAERGATDSFLKDKIDFKIVAERNSLGRAAAVVLPFNPKAPRDRGNEDTWNRPTILFPLLAPWAIDDRTLALDLPRDVPYKAESDELEKRLQAFSRPGRLHVWFLRGDKVLWEDQLDWPGQ